MPVDIHTRFIMPVILSREWSSWTSGLWLILLVELPSAWFASSPGAVCVYRRQMLLGAVVIIIGILLGGLSIFGVFD